MGCTAVPEQPLLVQSQFNHNANDYHLQINLFERSILYLAQNIT